MAWHDCNKESALNANFRICYLRTSKVSLPFNLSISIDLTLGGTAKDLGGSNAPISVMFPGSDLSCNLYFKWVSVTD